MAIDVNSTRKEIEDELIKRCWEDDDFKNKLMADSKAVVESLMGDKLPPGFSITVHEESQNQIHIVIPVKPDFRKLSDDDLEKITAGFVSDYWSL
ncbi:MAG: NHLP leader peptide family RiPP precursor [Syntrophomonas sp.]